MAHFLLILGIVFLLLISYDIFTTIVHLGGGGFLSKPITTAIWKVLFKLSKQNSRSKLLDYAGGIILTSLILFWIMVIWIGYFWVFSFEYDSVIASDTKLPATPLEKFYYIGYTLTSLGNGSYAPSTDFWRIISNIMGLTSMIYLSLGITYLIPVLQATLEKRVLATYIYNLGRNPIEILDRAWNGEDFSALDDKFNNLETMILKHAENHLAYPVLHYFHSTNHKFSAPLNLAIIDEVLNIEYVFGLEKQEKRYHFRIMRSVMENYLSKLEHSYITPTENPPEFNYEQYIKRPIRNSRTKIAYRLDSLEKRRKALLGLIRKDGWNWENDVISIDTKITSAI